MQHFWTAKESKLILFFSITIFLYMLVHNFLHVYLNIFRDKYTFIFIRLHAHFMQLISFSILGSFVNYNSCISFIGQCIVLSIQNFRTL